MNGPALHERLQPPPPGASRCRTPPRPCPSPAPWSVRRWPSWSTPADSDTAELLTAELVANAVEHTAGDAPIELVVELLPTGCQVEVHDPDPAPPGDLTRPGPAREPDPWQEHGRGLLLIRTLSSSCGHRPTDVRQGGLVQRLPYRRPASGRATGPARDRPA